MVSQQARSKRALSSARRAAVKDMARRQTATLRTIIYRLEMQKEPVKTGLRIHTRKGVQTFADSNRMGLRCRIRLVGDCAKPLQFCRFQMDPRVAAPLLGAVAASQLKGLREKLLSGQWEKSPG